MTGSMSFGEIGVQENEVLGRFIKIIETVRIARRDRGESVIQDNQVFIGKLLDLLRMYASQRHREQKIDEARESFSQIEKLSMALCDALSGLDHFELAVLLEARESRDVVASTKWLAGRAASLSGSQSRGRKGDVVVRNLASLFVIMCIEHDWLPIRVANSAAAEADPSDHCKCLAMVFDAAGLLDHVASPKDRTDLLHTKSSSALRSLRKGFDYVAVQSEVQREFGESFLYGVRFDGKASISRLVENNSDIWLDGDDQIDTLPNFIPPDVPSA